MHTLNQKITETFIDHKHNYISLKTKRLNKCKSNNGIAGKERHIKKLKGKTITFNKNKEWQESKKE
jgi:hypothetical protein